MVRERPAFSQTDAEIWCELEWRRARSRAEKRPGIHTPVNTKQEIQGRTSLSRSLSGAATIYRRRPADHIALSDKKKWHRHTGLCRERLLPHPGMLTPTFEQRETGSPAGGGRCCSGCHTCWIRFLASAHRKYQIWKFFVFICSKHCKKPLEQMNCFLFAHSIWLST